MYRNAHTLRETKLNRLRRAHQQLEEEIYAKPEAVRKEIVSIKLAKEALPVANLLLPYLMKCYQGILDLAAEGLWPQVPFDYGYHHEPRYNYDTLAPKQYKALKKHLGQKVVNMVYVEQITPEHESLKINPAFYRTALSASDFRATGQPLHISTIVPKKTAYLLHPVLHGFVEDIEYTGGTQWRSQWSWRRYFSDDKRLGDIEKEILDMGETLWPRGGYSCWDPGEVEKRVEGRAPQVKEQLDDYYLYQTDRVEEFHWDTQLGHLRNRALAWAEWYWLLQTEDFSPAVEAKIRDRYMRPLRGSTPQKYWDIAVEWAETNYNFGQEEFGNLPEFVFKGQTLFNVRRENGVLKGVLDLDVEFPGDNGLPILGHFTDAYTPNCQNHYERNDA